MQQNEIKKYQSKMKLSDSRDSRCLSPGEHAAPQKRISKFRQFRKAE